MGIECPITQIRSVTVDRRRSTDEGRMSTSCSSPEFFQAGLTLVKDPFPMSSYSPVEVGNSNTSCQFLLSHLVCFSASRRTTDMRCGPSNHLFTLCGLERRCNRGLPSPASPLGPLADHRRRAMSADHKHRLYVAIRIHSRLGDPIVIVVLTILHSTIPNWFVRNLINIVVKPEARSLKAQVK